MMIFWSIFIIVFPIFINATHFNGGTITWKPVDPYTNSSTVVITITQTYAWVLSLVKCDRNAPISSSNFNNTNLNLSCIANCLNDGGYSSKPIDILTDCISSSSSLDMMTSQRSKNVTLTVGAFFSIAYQSGGWRSLNNVDGNSNWALATWIDLRRRSDGTLNTPPEPNVVSPQNVIVNRTTRIRIPVSDVNQGDNIRCRWAEKNRSSVDECNSVCYSNKLPPGTTLSSNCELTITGRVPNNWFAVAIQVEDFIDSTSTTPMSSVPIQFLIHVLPEPNCTEVPLILSFTDCPEVQIGTPIRFNLHAINYCNNNQSIITDISISTPISSMNTSELYNFTGNTSLSYKTVDWIPQMNQIGTQKFCAIAYTNEQVQSEEYCTTFFVESKSEFCQGTTNGMTLPPPPTTTTTRLTAQTTVTKGESNSNKPNIGLIVGLSILGFLLALCCCCCWFYFLCWPDCRRRSRNTVTTENNYYYYTRKIID